jgi:hypothetical protein
MTSTGGYLSRPAPSGLADVVEVILDKGLVIDAYVRVSLLGIELLTIDARVVVASVDTYLRFAEAANRLDLSEHAPPSLVDVAQAGTEAVVERVAESVAERKVEAVKEGVTEAVETVTEKVRDALPGGADKPRRG